MTEQPIIETNRLRLRPFRLDDAPRVQALAGAREVADTTLHIPHPYPDGAAEAWIATHAPVWGRGMGATYAICHREQGVLVGAIALALAPEHVCGELGYWVAVSEWNRGYCTEAGRAVLDWAFDVRSLHRVQARHLVRNPASGRVMQKLGMQLEGIHRGAVRRWGAFEDVALYATLADSARARS